jgi:transposase-like protein
MLIPVVEPGKSPFQIRIILNRAGFAGGSNPSVGWSLITKTTNKYSPEVRERAVRLVLDGAGQHESRWAAIVPISSKIGCAPQTLNEWVKKIEVDTGQRGGITPEQAEKMKALEREVRELQQANEILRKASAYFAQAERDRPLKR